jgi:hypothetical protein
VTLLPNVTTRQSQDGNTALMFAAQNGQDGCVRLLVNGDEHGKIAKNKVLGLAILYA